MIELLTTAPGILSINQEHVPKCLRGRFLIFYIKEQDVVILVNWGEHAATLAKVIIEYLKLSPGDEKDVSHKLRDLGLHDTVMELFGSLERIYQKRGCKETYEK